MTDLARLLPLLTGRRLVALTGAGCSTESGIPDYRGPTTRHKPRNPVQYRDFIGSADARQRYWARSMVGWPHFSAARPNPAHDALARLEASGVLAGILTQNVDRLHHAAGSRRVIELHGALAEVVCLGCGTIEDRDVLQHRLKVLNPDWVESAELSPDGDAELSDVARFQVADCLACGGTLKPKVVFFGENVARPVVDAAFSLLHEGEVLLVVGSSLTVYSGFRFARAAAERGVPVVIVNLGETRADGLATLRVDAAAGAVLPALVALASG